MDTVGGGPGRGWAAAECGQRGADSPMGEVTVEFAPPNEVGVLDHVVRLPSGEAVYNPLRVIPGGVGEARCEVLFTVRRGAGMTDAEFEADAAAVAAAMRCWGD